MTHDLSTARDQLPLAVQRQIDELCDEFESVWRAASEGPPFAADLIESFLPRVEPAARALLLHELIQVEIGLCKECGLPVNRGDYERRFSSELPRGWAIGEETTAFDLGGLLSATSDHTPRPSPLAAGTMIDQFVIGENLGGGSFGNVYRALDTKLNREVALKLLHHEGRDAEVLRQARAEPETLAALDHRNIVPVYGTGEFGGRCYFVSKLVTGGTLAERLKTGGALPAEQAAEIVAQIAEALAYAHAHSGRYVHRDVKPANILLEADGNPLLADFGLALTARNFTLAKHSAGTLLYMSPEQVQGDAGIVDGRSDIYSLGVVLYEVLTGKTPYRSTSSLDLEQEIVAVAPSPPRQLRASIPEALQAICLRCLAKDPADRYSTAADLVADLRSYLRRASGRQLTWQRRAAIAAAICCVGLTVFAILPWGGAPPAAERAIVVEMVELHVQRDSATPKIESRRLIADGKEQPVDGLSPLGINDRFVLLYRFSQPTPWCLVHIDPQGGSAIVAKSIDPTSEVRVPDQTGQGVSFRADDPKGANLLLLLAGTPPIELNDADLAKQVAEDGTLLKALPTRWSQLRAGITQHESVIQLPQDYLTDLERRLPAGLKTAHALFLQSQP